MIILQNKIDDQVEMSHMSYDPKELLDSIDLGFTTMIPTSGKTGEGLRLAMQTMIKLIEDRDLMAKQNRRTRVRLTKQSEDFTRELERLNKKTCF
jgi:hypothetical protein